MTETSPKFQTTRFHWAFLLSTALLTLLIDQITKALIVANLSLYEEWIPIPALGRFFEITYTQNTGAAFGLFSSAGTFFLIIAAVASVVILYYYREVDGNKWLIRMAMGLQMGGALGNALDRVTRGYVVDFLHVHYEPHFDYPVFNVADSAIVIGVVLLIILLWWDDRKAAAVQKEQAAHKAELVVPEEEQRI